MGNAWGKMLSANRPLVCFFCLMAEGLVMALAPTLSVYVVRPSSLVCFGFGAVRAMLPFLCGLFVDGAHSGPSTLRGTKQEARLKDRAPGLFKRHAVARKQRHAWLVFFRVGFFGLHLWVR